MQDASGTRSVQAARAARNRWEWPIVIGLLLIAFFFRVWQLNDVPPGLHHDEVIIGQVAKDILRGHFAIYFTPGYGHEPLYHYVVAGMFGAIGANAFVLRLTSAFIALLGLAATYAFTRRIFSPGVAIGTLAWMSISLWPVFFARVGLRGIILPLLTTLTAYFLWKAVFGPKSAESSAFVLRPSSFILPGILLGLTLYTYQASRVFPLIFGLFLLFAFSKRWWAARRAGHVSRSTHDAVRSTLTFFITALIVAAPLIIYLAVINPSAESRVSDLGGPLNQLRAGNPAEVMASTLNTLGMFTYRGDAVPIYNVSGRPVFPEIFGAALFVIGLLISVWRWKQPAYALMLIWFFVSLIPAMVTPFSPNFVRTIAAWPVPFVFAGLAMAEVVQFVRRRSNQQSAIRNQKLAAVLFALAFIWNAVLTFNDYFVQWPAGDYVRFWQQATWTQAVRALNADRSSTPIAASGLSIQDFDPQTFDLLGLRSDLKVKWFDCRNAMVYPQDAVPARYLVPAYLPCDVSRWGAELLAQVRWPASEEAAYSLYGLDPAQPRIRIQKLSENPVYLGNEDFNAQAPMDGLTPVGLPDFDGLQLFGGVIDRTADTPLGDVSAFKAGTTVLLDTYWMMKQPVTPPVKIFVHLTAPDGKIVAQSDGLDVNMDTLDVGDMFGQRHRLELPADLPPGPYRISLGAYHPDSGERLQAQLDDRAVDSVVLGTLTLVK
jgi:4-amino-4-deoxy-L-arabinose transferase-like glycosyltransferase